MSMLQHIEDELYELDYTELTYIKNACEEIQRNIMDKAKKKAIDNAKNMPKTQRD